MRNDNGASVRRRVPYVNAPGIAVGIEEELVRAVVEAFYVRVRTDADLGPIPKNRQHRLSAPKAGEQSRMPWHADANC
jgi:hypothetical protein